MLVEVKKFALPLLEKFASCSTLPGYMPECPPCLPPPGKVCPPPPSWKSLPPLVPCLAKFLTTTAYNYSNNFMNAVKKHADFQLIMKKICMCF